jgi:hypothetical protein
MLCLSIFISNAQQTIVLSPNGTQGKDASIWSVGVNDNYANRESLHAYTWTHNGNLSVIRSLVEFDFSSIPSNATILSAELSLFFNPTDSFQFNTHKGDNAMYIRRVLGSWTENGITWNNQPSTTTVNQVFKPSVGNTTQDYLDIDVTAMVTDMLVSPSGNNGFMLSMENETDYYRGLAFASSDHPVASLRPKLVIVYSENSTTCLNIKPNALNGKDASIWSIGTNDNYSSRHSLHAYTWTNNSSLSVIRSFVEFDFSLIPSNATILSADLSLYFNPNDSFSFDTHKGDNVLHIQRVLNSWTENGITWNNQPSTTTINQVVLNSTGGTTQNYLDIDVKDMVSDIFSSSNGNNGFMLRMENETDFFRAAVFASSDHPNANLHPEINICWQSITSVNDFSNSKYNLKFSVYPNPNNGRFNLSIENNSVEAHKFVIHNAIGQEVMNGNINSDLIEIDLSNQNSGFYLIKVINGNGNSATERILLN